MISFQCSFNILSQFFKNTITGHITGIALVSDSRTNEIYHNNFIDNYQHAYAPCYNTWDDGYPSGGNYWDAYNGEDHYSGPDQNEAGSDGIGDTPYNIPGRIPPDQDRYPLMEPYGLIPGDLDLDGDVDQSDLSILLSAWDSYPDDPNWNSWADIDDDGHVYHSDLGILLANWGYGT